MLVDSKDTEKNTIEFIKEVNSQQERIKILEDKVLAIETYFIGVVTDSTHYVSSDSGTWTGKKITITNGLIKSIG